MTESTRYMVYTDGRYSRCVEPDSSAERLCLNDGWEFLFQWDGDRFSAWTKTVVDFGLHPEDYDDRMMPISMSTPVELFRSVSVAEFEDIMDRGAICGGGNRFNDFEHRPFVFFSPSMSERCIWQGEELERAAAYAASVRLDPSLGFSEARAAFIESYRPALEALRAKMDAAPFTSAVLRTAPVSIGLHYSHEHGRSGMGEEDEYGLFPGQVKASDIVDVTLVRKGKPFRTLSVEEARGFLEKEAEAPIRQQLKP